MKKSVLFILFALVSVAGFSQITGWNATLVIGRLMRLMQKLVLELE